MEQKKKIRPLFDFGKIVATRLLANDMEQSPEYRDEVLKCFERHILGDWGDLGQEDQEANNEDLKNNCGRLLSRYHTSKQDIYIMTQYEPETQTEAAIYTTLMYCNEY